MVLAATVAGCGAVGRVTSGDPATGKTLFVSKCGSCHALAAAGTTGTVGPSLDDAFRADKSGNFASGGTEQTIRDIVRGADRVRTRMEADCRLAHPTRK